MIVDSNIKVWLDDLVDRAMTVQENMARNKYKRIDMLLVDIKDLVCVEK